MLASTPVSRGQAADNSSVQEFSPLPSLVPARMTSASTIPAQEGVAATISVVGGGSNAIRNGDTASVAWCNHTNGGGGPSPNATLNGRSRLTSLSIVVEGSDREEERRLSTCAINSYSLGKDATQGGCAVEPAIAAPTAAVTVAPSSSAVMGSSPPTACENLVQWRRPKRQVVFREWYTSRYCNEQQVRWIERMQHACRPLQPLLVRYFQLWSWTGEAEFYTLLLPTTVWLGNPLSGVHIASLLFLGQYVTGTLKDSVCCPRPPCPPLQLRGKRETHVSEYGFPSTHSCHSVVFSFFLYCELACTFPENALWCWLTAACFFANVSFSRIYLGMHWISDVVGGAAVALFIILFHVAFLSRWEAYILERADAPWWAYALVYVTLHLLSMAYATPHDPCPCYVDSLRFTGSIMGSTVGFWGFYSIYGTLAARPKPDRVLDVMLSFSFMIQWLVCMVIVIGSKELSSLIAGVALKVVFKFLSGVYATRLPKPLRKPYLLMAKVIGLTTLDNGRGSRPYIPIAADSSSSFGQGGGETDILAQDGKITAAAVGRSTPNARIGTEAAGEPDGYFNSYQVWSLRTHRHWWLWDVHRSTVSYAVTGFVITFACQVLLREGFGVGQERIGPAGHRLQPRAPAPE
ncbi:hypothetical protein CUR178_02361 [Leishmania enriettii]|uniref:Phosphatidic acid phosphatase type 2/haloperoxidase domain-containing protein n=1 Tax=Leishmania enriettii TaxID=5663 RepID=A0A836GF70_LEIEN|nr:hypothetical protein CUR178_02361 [Leishmania enriettii]